MVVGGPLIVTEFLLTALMYACFDLGTFYVNSQFPYNNFFKNHEP